MLNNAQLSSLSNKPVVETERERAVFDLIGRGLIDHKESFYACHRTGLTAEIAWPVMESILGYVRPYLGCPGVPAEPTPEMIQAALQASLKLRDEWGVEEVAPDSPGKLPSEMVRTVWRAMLEAMPQPAMQNTSEAVADAIRTSAQPVQIPGRTAAYSPVGYDGDPYQDSRAQQWLKKAGLAIGAILTSKSLDTAVEKLGNAYSWTQQCSVRLAAVWKSTSMQQHRIMRKNVGLRH